MSGVQLLPRFLPNGLRVLEHTGEHWRVHWRNEADLRDALAALWWLHGADVRTEVKVPDCGRVDVLVSDDRIVRVIEVKKSITTPTLARQAFQQAQAYVRYLEAEELERWLPELAEPDERPRRVEATVTAATYDRAAAAMAARAYSDVDGYEYGEAMYDACHGELFATETVPATAVNNRLGQIRQLADLLRLAEIDLITRDETKRLSELQVPELQDSP